MVEYYHLDKVVEYVELLDNATTAAKVGFFLDQHREQLMVDPYTWNASRLCVPSRLTTLSGHTRATASSSRIGNWLSRTS